MEEEVENVQQEGTPVEAASQEQPKTFDYVTREELRQTIEEVVRKVQSSTDKSVGSASKKLKAEVDAAKALLLRMGDEVTPAKEALIRQTVMEQHFFSDNEPSPQGGQAASAQAPQLPAGMDPMQAVAKLEKKMKVSLEEGDPEIKAVDVYGSPFEYYDSYREALEAKQKRLAEAPSPKRTPTTAGGHGAASVKLTAEDYKKEALANRGKGFDVMHKLRAKYINAGVDIDSVHF